MTGYFLSLCAAFVLLSLLWSLLSYGTEDTQVPVPQEEKQPQQPAPLPPLPSAPPDDNVEEGIEEKYDAIQDEGEDMGDTGEEMPDDEPTD
jgi:hypothetical protein